FLLRGRTDLLKRLAGMTAVAEVDKMLCQLCCSALVLQRNQRLEHGPTDGKFAIVSSLDQGRHALLRAPGSQRLRHRLAYKQVTVAERLFQRPGDRVAAVCRACIDEPGAGNAHAMRVSRLQISDNGR